MLHGDCTLTVHKEGCRDLNNPSKARSSGLESGYIYAKYVDFLDPERDKNLMIEDHKELHDLLYDYHPMQYSNIKIEFMGCTENKGGK